MKKTTTKQSIIIWKKQINTKKWINTKTNKQIDR